jgi:hypothetical protein
MINTLSKTDLKKLHSLADSQEKPSADERIFLTRVLDANDGDARTIAKEILQQHFPD